MDKPSSASDNLIALNAEAEWTTGELKDSLRSMGIDADSLPPVNLIGTRVHDIHLKRYRTVVAQKPDGGVKVKDGDEVGTWLTVDEYFREPHICDDEAKHG